MNYRIFNAIKMGYWAFRNPSIMDPRNMEVLTKIFELIMRTATEQRYMMTHIAYVHPTEGEKEIVSIWAGAGVAADPVKRIKELRDENLILREMLRDKTDLILTPNRPEEGK